MGSVLNDMLSTDIRTTMDYMYNPQADPTEKYNKLSGEI